MNFSAKSRRSAARPRDALLLMVVAVGICGFIFWQRAQNSPVNQRIERGIELSQQGRDTAAEAQWRQAVQLDPKNARAWSLLGNFYFEARDYKAARAALQNAVTLEPVAPDAQLHLAQSAFQLDDYGAAHKTAQTALEQAPDSIAALQLLAQIERQTDDKEARLKHLQTLVELQPQNAESLADLVNELGERQEYDKAVPLAERLVKLTPNSASAHFLRGLALFSATPDDKALMRAQGDFEKTLELQPNNIEAHRYLARTLMLRNQPLRAITEFEAVGRGRPYALAHLLELSNAYRRAGQAGRADEIAARFESIKQFNSEALELTKTIERQPQSAGPLLQLSRLLMRGLQGDDALFQLYRYRYSNDGWKTVGFYLDKARRLAPGNAATRAAESESDALLARTLSQSEAALKGGDTDTAKASIWRALLLRPDAPRTRAVLQQFAARGLDPKAQLPIAGA